MTPKIQRFEDFIAWQKARALTASVYEITNQGGFARDYGLQRSDPTGRCFDYGEYSRGFRKKWRISVPALSCNLKSIMR